MKQLLISTYEDCPLRAHDGYCTMYEREYAIRFECSPTPGTKDFPNYCKLKDAPNCPDCGNCDGSCQKGDSEPILTDDEEIDKLILGIRELKKRFWTSGNMEKCIRAEALLEDIDLDKEVDEE